MPTVVIVDAMRGVRDGLRWILACAEGVEVVADVATMREASTVDADVIVSRTSGSDGDGVGSRPVVVHTWLPPDETAGVVGAVAVVRHGQLRTHLAAAVRAAAAAQR